MNNPTPLAALLSRTPRRAAWPALSLALIATGALLVFAAPTAQAKELVDYFGTDPVIGSGTAGGQFDTPAGVAVNTLGNGPAEAGDVYVVDRRNDRIERFARDTKGTATPYDDTYAFVSAWGADVVQSGGSGDPGDHPPPTMRSAPSRPSARPASPPAATAHPRATAHLISKGLSRPGIAVDQDSGDVYVTDSANFRINVYSGDGTFIRSFGYDVAESGPGNLAGADEVQTLTLAADGGKFSLEFRGAATAPRSPGRGAQLTIGSKTINQNPAVGFTPSIFSVGQGISAIASSNQFPPGTTITAVGANTLTASQPSTTSSSGGLFVDLFAHDLPHDATAQQVQDALNALPTVGAAGGSVSVSGPAGGPYAIAFGGSLADTDLPPIAARGENLTQGAGTGSATVTETTKGGAYEVCEAADADVCRAGSAGEGVGELGATFNSTGPFNSTGLLISSAAGIALSPPDGNPDSGTVFLADAANVRVDSYALDGSAPSSLGSTAQFPYSNPTLKTSSNPSSVAVDSRGILYADSTKNNGEIERYDTEDANGTGIGFLAPIAVGTNEKQTVTVAATAGAFKLSFDPDGGGPEPAQVTADIAYNASSNAVRDALAALPAVALNNNVSVSGGPGNGAGSTPYTVTFSGALGALDVAQLGCANGSTPLSGGAGCSVSTTTPGADGLIPGNTTALAADPATDTLYVARGGVVQQFGPTGAPGLTAPPSADDARHATHAGLNSGFLRGLALDESATRLYATDTDTDTAGGGQSAHGVYVLDDAGPDPTATLDSCPAAEATATTITCHATIDPNGPPLLSYRFQYSADGGSSWSSLPSVELGHPGGPPAGRRGARGPRRRL